MKVITRLIATLAAGFALGLGGVGVAQASHGADDPPGHEAHHHHHHHGNDHRSNHDAGDDHGGDNDDGPNHA